jgi:hypothetical protein
LIKGGKVMTDLTKIEDVHKQYKYLALFIDELSNAYSYSWFKDEEDFAEFAKTNADNINILEFFDMTNARSL